MLKKSIIIPSTTFMRVSSREFASDDNQTALSRDFRYYLRRFRQRVLLIKKVIAWLAELIIVWLAGCIELIINSTDIPQLR